MSGYHLSMAEREILSGPGSLDSLAGAVTRRNWGRVLVCASPSMRQGGHLNRIASALGDRLAGSYEEVAAHVQDHQLAAALTLAVEHNIDAVIGVGGGSPVGMAKAVSKGLEDHRPGQPLIPVIGIPTTYAGSEMTAVFGVTHNDHQPPRKVTVHDGRVTPRLVIYDPDLTLSLPPDVTASSGINALAHCIEALYSKQRNPLATAAAQEGIAHITRALPRCVEDGSDREARADLMTGSALAAFALSLTTAGLHHGLCHVLGGSAGIPHGIANGLMLPHAMRFNLDATAPEQALAARAMGIAVNGKSDEMAGRAAADAVYKLIGRLGLPQHLRDVGIAESGLPRLGELALVSRAVQENPKPVTEAAQAESVYRAAW